MVKSNLNVVTGQKIRKLRVSLGWTQMIVANKLGMSIPAYSKIESGSTDVNLSRLEQIAHVLGVNVIGLLSEGKELMDHITRSL